MNIEIGTLLRKIGGNGQIYLITEETDRYFVATLVGNAKGLYRRLFKDMNHDDLEVIG